MKTLLVIVVRYNNILLFLLLQAVSLFLMARTESYHSSKIVAAVRGVTATLHSYSDNVKIYLSLRDINERLVSENLDLKERIGQLTLQSHHIYDTLTLTGDTSGYAYSVHRVVNNTVNRQRNYFTIKGGSSDGLERDMAVAGPEGIAGIIVTVADNYSVAMSVLNSDFRLSARLAESGYFGSLSWDGRDRTLASLTDIPYHISVAEGDLVETSGFGALFPPGLTVGTVVSVDETRGDFYRIDVELATDFRRLDYVYVIANRLRNEQIEVERGAYNE